MTCAWTPQDIDFMQMALKLAASQLGNTGDNPAVGCVIVRDGIVIGQGVTANGGRPHGEAMAMASVVGDAVGATLYVTLEPCAHISERGPDCTSTLIEAGIARLVCCLQDPDPRTAGKGFARLTQAGIKVEVGLFAHEGDLHIADFKLKIALSRH